jgi:protein SCO1/2
MSEMLPLIKQACGDVVMPIMISCDPARDPPDILKDYLAEFHPDIIGLTGTYENVKQTCKAYRVYFSTPEKVKPGEDYMVDHSIYFFLMGMRPHPDGLANSADPEGDFVEVLGRNYTTKEAVQVIINHVKDWDGFLDESPRRRGSGYVPPTAKK